MLLEIGVSGDQLEISGSFTYWEHQHLAQNKCARNAGHFSYLCQPPQGVMGWLLPPGPQPLLLLKNKGSCKELLTSLSCPCLESFSLSLVSLTLPLSWPLTQFGRYLIYYLLNRQTYSFPLLNFTTLQVLVTVITNIINHLHGSFKSIQIVSVIQQNTLVWGYFILSLFCLTFLTKTLPLKK